MQAATTTNYTPTSPSITPNPTIIHESTQPEGTYQGELKENLRDGLGVFIWQNGDTYFGQWAEDKMHGKGIFCYNTGHYVEGNFCANLVNGPACLTYPDGSFIKGVFTNGELSGRVIFYQAETNVWYLQTYEAGKLQGIHYEGSGKPLTYDFCVNIYEEDPQAYSTRSADNNYKIAVTQKDSGILDSLGCFEMDAETRHFGVTKDNRISGFGLRVHPKYIEAGKYRDGHLEGFGRRLEFGKYLYEGEFLQGMSYGQGGLYQWKERTLIVGIFTKSMLMQKFDERFFSLLELDNFSRLHGHTGIREVIKFAVRTYEDAFAKSYSEPKSKVAQLNSPTTTIREIEYAKIIARETIIEQSEGPCHTAPVTKGNLHEIQTNDYVRQRLKENPNFLKHKRSHSSESPFSQLFKIHVGNKQVNSQNNRRSASAIRHTNSQPDSGRNQLMFGSLSSNDPRFTLMNSSLHFNRLRSSEAGSPGAILTFGRSDEKEYPSVGDISPHLYSSLGSLKGLSQASPLTNPFTVSNNGSNLVLGSPPSSGAIDLHKKKVGSGWDLPSPVEKVPTTQYQAKKLNRDRSASKSTVGLYNRISNNGSQTTRQRSPVYQIDGSSTSREKGSSPSIVYNHKHTQSMLPGDSQNRGWETMRNPSSIATNSTTPTKNRKVGGSPISRGNTVNSQMLTKKGSGSMSISSGISQKKTEQKQAGPYGLVYVGSSAYAKKTVSSTSNNNNINTGGSTSRTKDVSPLGRNTSAIRKDNNIVITKSNNRDQDSRMGKSPRVSRGSQAQSPAYTNDLSLQSYSISDKIRSDKKEGAKQVNSKGTLDKSPRSGKNIVMTAPTSPQKASSTAVENSMNTKQFMQKTAMESYSNSNNDEKLSARSKSPFMMTGGVIGESSLFRSKTPGGISDFDYQKTTVGTGRAQSPISTFRGGESPFVDSDRMTPFESQQNGRFSFIPENESPYSSITQRDSVKSALRQDDSGSAVYKELIKEGKKTPVCSFDLSGKSSVVVEKSEVIGHEVKEKGAHRRAASQVVLTETEKQIVSVLKTPKFSLATAKPGQCETPRSSNRYNTQLHLQSNLQATVEPIAQNNRKLTVDTRISTSPDRNKTGAGSPYKIDIQQQRINSRGASPRKDKLESPQHSQGSLCRHSHRDNDGLDSPPQYPVKKTCDPKMDTEYYKDSSRKGSPPRDSKVLDTNRQGSAAGSPDNKQDPHTHTQTKESLASSDAKFTRKFENTPDGKESSEGQRRISITDIFRKSLTMVQSRGENGSEGGEFDMKALQTVVSRYDNCTDSRSLQAFPTKGSQKITESSPRQSLASKAMLTSYSNNMPIMPIQRMSPPKNTMEAKTSSPDKDLEYDLTERLKFCLEQTKANIARIEREAAEGNVYYKDSEFLTGVKRQNPEMRPSVTSVTGDIKTTGSSSINGKIAAMKEIKHAAPAEIISVKAKLAGNKGMLSARTSVAGPWALIKENPSLVNESGGETSRAAFTFRDQKDSEGVLNMVQKGYGNEGGEKTVKHYQRSSSLSKRQSKMAGLQVRSIALYKDDLNQSNERSLSRERNSVTDVKRRK